MDINAFQAQVLHPSISLHPGCVVGSITPWSLISFCCVHTSETYFFENEDLPKLLLFFLVSLSTDM